ncbi:PstS family phosphate ABC transporter substrate-binding protein [Pararhodobacter marinus]|uniref:Phosphonate ABC transporter substrate-binding protein n=1 Tax=Pararhodobacter marinus TaxID=2184063 RepID=A0A2U2CAZ4_9RHOB|nr:substrate-binding domain-containing protein [Pararhodobacter marinus]PWE29037.1 phosphonate ABC transporter substrate-binding protein [Pararhodobacter marinus]
MFVKTTSRLAIIAAAGVMVAAPAFAQSRTNIQIAGSSTVLPFASIVAEEFGQMFPEFETPVVASGGSSGGLRQFCAGVGPETIDIANASRAIRSSEIEACAAAGVSDIREIRIGYDGIVFASAAEGPEFVLEPQFVYQAIAANLPEGTEAPTLWSDIDPSLPEQPIMMAIPASNHGTREVFEEKVIFPGCEAVMGEDTDHEVCGELRQDNVIEIAGDYTETLARLSSDANTVGVFGLSFYEQNTDTLRVATMSGVTPSLETVASGEYPVSRPLFFYVKGEHIGVIPGIEEYVQFFLSDAMAGAGGRLEEAGMIPAPAEETAEVLENFMNGVTVSQ